MGRCERILARWRTRSCLLGEQLQAQVGGALITGKVLGIRSTGQLILQDARGDQHLLSEERTKLVL
jgi:biotin-(acetyl-CoA carboxylase) ligase